MSLDLKGNDLKLLAFQRLLANQESCEPYDGYSAEDQLGFFMDKHGYNPFVEAEKLWSEIIDIYLTDEIKKEFSNYYPVLSSEWEEFCRKLEKLLPDDLAKDVFVSMYTSKCSRK